jgi:phosphoglycolate phosphatase-like HAD superfamily hydrolase
VTRYRLVLLDVDGTLVQCGGAGRRALEQVIRKACGQPDGDLSALWLDGSTDRAIVRHGMELLGHPYSDALCDELLSLYPPVLAAELAAPTAYEVLPGAVEALEALRARKVAHGLCTGNVIEGARLKLRRGGLDRFFEWGPQAVGGFGSDDEVRARVVEAALRRAAARLGPLAPAEVLVVGDTPRDVEAARRTGCASLAVATGRYRKKELLACGADHVVETLAAPEALPLLAG